MKRGYGSLKGGAVSLFFMFFLLIPVTVQGNESHELRTLLKRTQEEHLYQERYWSVLLHYQPHASGFRSLIDDPKFFLSPIGKDNPQAELEATLEAFYMSPEKKDEHTICRFPARYAWLKEKLNLHDTDFPNVECRDLKNKRDASVQPRALVLVFPSSYMNNPASMFGHTMLRIDGGYQSRLLSHAVNYAAFVDDAGILYPVKGIFGFYKGYFKVFPYYERIKEYSDIEQRDMWEYRLNFSESEVQKMFLHLWELNGIYSYYYFFDENCSYNLLFLLEAARPSLQFTIPKPFWVIPIDTVRAVKESGIVTEELFRPALASRIRHISSLLPGRLRQEAMEIAEGKADPSQGHNTGNDHTRMLDLATEMTQYLYNKGEQTEEAYQKRYLSILKQRSKAATSDETSYKIPVPPAPETGHDSGRFGLGIGIRKDTFFQEIKYRPAYHSLMDPDGGYVEGSQIIFCETAFRYYSGGPLQLESLNMIDIISISPRDYFFKPLSWKVRTGLYQKMNRHQEDQLTYQLNPGVGMAYKSNITGMAYVMAEINLAVGKMFRDNYALGAGIQAGIIKHLSDSWKIHLTGESMFSEVGDSLRDYQLALIQSFTLSRNHSLNLSLSWKKTFNNEYSEALCNWHYFF